MNFVHLVDETIAGGLPVAQAVGLVHDDQVIVDGRDRLDILARFGWSEAIIRS